MKSLITKFTLLLVVLCLGLSKIEAQVVNVDPALSTAVAIAGKNEKKALDNIKEEQSKIQKLQTLATVQLKKIEDIQRKSYDYLSNVSAGVQNAYDIKRSFELTKSIGNLCVELKQAVVDNPQGLVTVAVATKYISSVTTEVASVYTYIASIALNKKTLLNSAERLQITWNVRNKLSNIYNRIYNLIYQIRALNFSHLPQLIAPEIYYGLVSHKTIADQVIRDYYGL